ncbi:MAG: hypothetical protein PWQ17_2598 [Anaerophaga sp.]|jgi:DNA-binding response OmpR family regulator|nr:hypothetical protein [Anaerophaga sp.]
MDINILIADDDSVFRQLICDIMKKKGYKVLQASNGKEAIDLFFSRTDIALCILDVMMPVYDGWEVLEEIRQNSDVPVLMLTALGDEIYEIKGLLEGADDYIAKPFSYPVFIARVEALLRKIKRQLFEKLAVGEISIDRSTHRVWVANEEIFLNNKEYCLLTYLVENRGIVLEREKILKNVWGYDFEGDIRTIDAHVKMLRSKLGFCSNYIKTIRGTGYMFEVSYEKEYSQ